MRWPWTRPWGTGQVTLATREPRPRQHVTVTYRHRSLCSPTSWLAFSVLNLHTPPPSRSPQERSTDIRDLRLQLGLWF